MAISRSPYGAGQLSSKSLASWWPSLLEFYSSIEPKMATSSTEPSKEEHLTALSVGAFSEHCEKSLGKATCLYTQHSRS